MNTSQYLNYPPRRLYYLNSISSHAAFLTSPLVCVLVRQLYVRSG
jgi:hypothetical protein